MLTFLVRIARQWRRRRLVADLRWLPEDDLDLLLATASVWGRRQWRWVEAFGKARVIGG
jgi:hypothetical protein